MIESRSIGSLLRRLQNRSRSAGLQPRRLVVQSAIVQRKARATRQRRSCRWSVSDARMGMAPDDDRAFSGKDAQVRGYTIWIPGQTGMCSPCARKGASR
jgi:hypothetical protein